jgi:hypothetical protein
VLVFVGAALDLGIGALLFGHLLTMQPAIRDLEWPTAAARAAVYLGPALVALLALAKGRSLLAAAIVLNFVTIIVIPESLFAAPLLLLAVLPLVLAWTALREDLETKTAWGPVVVGVFGVAAAIGLALGPQRNVDFSVLSRNGRVVQSRATVIRICPSSFSGSFTGEETSESGCDPIVDARFAETALMLSGAALLAGAALHARREAGD